MCPGLHSPDSLVLWTDKRSQGKSFPPQWGAPAGGLSLSRRRKGKPGSVGPSILQLNASPQWKDNENMAALQKLLLQKISEKMSRGRTGALLASPRDSPW